MKKWLMAQSAAVKATLAVVSVLVLALVGVAVYVGVKPAEEAAPVAVVSIDDADTPLTDAPDAEAPKEETEETVVAETPVVDVVYEEEVRAKEGYDLVNGNFADGTYGFEVYAYDANSIYYDTNDSGLTIRISDTGTEDWHVQLKQNQIRLEQGRWYRLSLDAKSDMSRAITCTMQHNGLVDNDWTPYSTTQTWNLGSNWQTYSVLFRMDNATDNDAVFNVSMGTVNGRRITSNHAISINNIKLEAMPANFIDSLRSGDNLIANPTFEYGDVAWDGSVVAPGQATTSFTGNKATFNISNTGTVDWHVQLKQSGINLEKDQCYKLSFDVTSSVARTMKVGIMDTNYVNWYGGGDVVATADKQTVTIEFQNTIASDANAILMLSMGKIEGVDTPASTIALENFSLVKIDKLSGASGSGSTVFGNGWEAFDYEAKHTKGAFYSVSDGYQIDLLDTGSDKWHVQLTYKPLNLVKGATYQVSFQAKSSIRRNISFMMQHNGNLDNNWATYDAEKVELTTEWQTFTYTFKMPQNDENVVANFSLGYDISDGLTWFSFIGEHSVNIKSLGVVQIVEEQPEFDGCVVVGENEKGWIEKEIAMADLLGDVKPEDVSSIKFWCDMKFCVGYNKTAGGWVDFLDDAYRKTSYSYKDIAFDASYALKAALWNGENGGTEHTIYWKVIKKGEETEEPEAIPYTVVIAPEKSGWMEIEIPLDELLGDVKAGEVESITFNGNEAFAVGYNKVGGGWSNYADERVKQYTCNDIVLGDGYALKFGLVKEADKEVKITWTITKKEAAPEKEPNTLVLGKDKSGWLEVEISKEDLLGDVKAEDVESITFNGNAIFAVGYNKVGGGWAGYPDDGDRTTTYTFDNIILNDDYALKVGLGKGGDSEVKITWTITKKEAVPEKEPNTLVLEKDKSGWFEVEISKEDLLGDVKAEDVESITFNGNAIFAVGYNKVGGGWAGYPNDGDRTTTYTFDNIIFNDDYALKVGIGKGGDSEVKITWTVNKKAANDNYVAVITNATPKNDWGNPEIEIPVDSTLIGKKVRVDVVLESDDAFGGILGGCNTSSWNWTATDQIDSPAGTSTWTYEFYEMQGAFKVQLYWKNADEVRIKSVTFTEIPTYVAVITNATPKNDWGNPEIELSIDNALVGKKVKVDVVLESDDAFGGILGGCNTSSWVWTATNQIDSPKGTSTWTYEFYEMQGALKVQLYWKNADEVRVKSVTFTEIVETPQVLALLSEEFEDEEEATDYEAVLTEEFEESEEAEEDAETEESEDAEAEETEEAESEEAEEESEDAVLPEESEETDETEEAEDAETEDSEKNADVIVAEVDKEDDVQKITVDEEA